MQDRTANRFPTLDELRGMAAFGVLLSHAYWGLLPRGHLAVDFLFLLSGFVIGRAYEARLAEGQLSPGGFVRARLRRLCPALLAGMMFYLAIRLCVPVEPAMQAVYLLNLLMIPVFGGDAAFPLNGPLWSLFFELLANLVYVAVLPALSTRRLALFVALSGVALAGAGLGVGNIRFGWQGNSPGLFLGGLLRIGWGFGLGLLIFRLVRDGAIRVPAIAPRVAPLLFVLAMLAPMPAPLGDFVCAGLVFPLVLLAAIGAGSSGWSPPAAWLGRISYPLYLLNWPLTQLARKLAVTVGDMLLYETLAAVAALLLAFWVERGYEAPVRAWLGRRRHRSASTLSGT